MNKKELLSFIRSTHRGKFTKACRLSDIEEAAHTIAVKKGEHKIDDNDSSEELDLSLSAIKADLLKRDGLVFVLILAVVFAIVAVQYYAYRELDSKAEVRARNFFQQTRKAKKAPRQGKIHYRQKKNDRNWR